MFQRKIFVFQNKKIESTFVEQQFRTNYNQSHKKTLNYEHVSNNKSKICAKSTNTEINMNFYLQNK